MSEPMWTTCSIVECGRVVLKAHVDRDGRCSRHADEVVSVVEPAHTPTEEEWQDMGRPAESGVVLGTMQPPTTDKRK